MTPARGLGLRHVRRNSCPPVTHSGLTGAPAAQPAHGVPEPGSVEPTVPLWGSRCLSANTHGLNGKKSKKGKSPLPTEITLRPVERFCSDRLPAAQPLRARALRLGTVRACAGSHLPDGATQAGALGRDGLVRGQIGIGLAEYMGKELGK